MKTDERGGASAGDNLEERLARQFAVDLDRAERDYPALRVGRRERDEVAASTGGRRSWRQLAGPVAAILILVAGGLVVAALATNQATMPGGPASAGTGVVLGSDGIPTQIDGQRVYRVGEKADWENLSGSFLLVANANRAPLICIAHASSGSPESDLLVGNCGGWSLGSTSGSGDQANIVYAAPKSSPQSLLNGWAGNPVVLRVHTHDPEAAQCSADQKANCEAAVVVEAVVWPAVPTEINGEHVYRATDQASFAGIDGSFLLGGLFSKPDVMPPCPAPIGKSAAEQQLIPYCFIESIDGVQISPSSNIDEPKNEIVAARVHVNDALAAQCPADVRATCQAAVVVESVVWTSNPYATASPTSAEPTATLGVNPVSSVNAGPPTPFASAVASSSIGSVGLDGLPTVFNGEAVYRAANLPKQGPFLLGGRLDRDTTCAAPSPGGILPPGCGFWTIDGVVVSNAIAIPESDIGYLVIARVTASKVLTQCINAPCPPISVYMVTAIVWVGPAVPAPPSIPPTSIPSVPPGT
ncbi:MAG: hypothetical protein ACHQ01_10830 [Candidatus Limnocylindrales bacterium]